MTKEEIILQLTLKALDEQVMNRINANDTAENIAEQHAKIISDTYNYLLKNINF